MVQSIFTFFRLFLSTIRGTESPRQLAWGVAFGMVIGLIPNDSLLVPILISVVLATRANLFVAAVSAIGFAWLGFALDQVLHRLGGQILITEAWQPLFAWANQAPILPWTRFNNTVVAGSIALSLCLFYPVYYLSHGFFERVSPLLHRKLVAYRVYRFLTASQPSLPATETGEQL